MERTRHLSVDEARRFAVRAQRLAEPFADVGEALCHLGYVQIDPINVCGRMHDLILRNRVRRYRPGDLLRHLHGDGSASTRAGLEHFVPGTGVLAALPLDAWPYLRPRMEQRRGDRRSWSGRLTPMESRLADRILGEIGERGPLTSDDIEHRGRAVTAWGSRARAVKTVMEKLLVHGRLLIARRTPHFRRVYDLPERVLPAAVRDLPAVGARELLRWRTLLRLRQRRLAVLPRATLALVVDRVIPVAVPGCPALFALAEDAPLFDVPPRRSRSAPHLLAPLDPLVYDRKVTRALWGFEYTWEVYTPISRRRRGYYALPVLYRNQLVGHVDPKGSPAQRELRIVSAQVGKHGDEALRAAAELARFLGLTLAWPGEPIAP